MGKVVQLLEGCRTGVDCPGMRPGVGACELTWKAELTFRHTGREVVAGEPDLLVPIARAGRA